MRIRYLLIFLFVIIQTAIAAQPISDDILNAKITSILKKDRTKYNLPALAISIKLPGEKVINDYVIGNTTLYGKVPINKNNLFQIGSITKSFTAAVALQLNMRENSILIRQLINGCQNIHAGNR